MSSDAPAAASAGVTDPALATLLEEHWEETMRRSPTWATRLGDHRFDDRIGDVSAAAFARDRTVRDGFLARARALAPGADALTLELFVEDLETSQREDVCFSEQWGLSARSNALVAVNELGDLQPITRAEQAAPFVARVRALPAYVRQDLDNLRAGIASGRTPNEASVRLVIEQIDRYLARDAAEWETAKPTTEPHPGWPEGASERFREDVVRLLRDAVRPAVAEYREFLHAELLPAARPADRIGVGALPEGAACYAALIERHTSLPLSADALHATGLRELERIHAEMRAVGGRALGTKDLPDLFERLRSDPALHFSTAEEVEARAVALVAAADAKVPEWFGIVPRASCGVKRIPDYEAPYTTIAYYMPSVPDGSAPGYYFVNTHAPETRPRFEAAVLAFHEAIPGHHLQIAIAQELPALPAFRRHLGTTAYVEGWALYTERLAEEMGLYADDLDRLGMLSFDAWRASRLVVDTGIHAMGWTRERSERFMLENTPLAENNIRNEVDRYITWPAQALAYKTGQLEMLRLRAEAERALGPRFDIRGFHDTVLSGGAMTLPALERRVRAWIASR